MRSARSSRVADLARAARLNPGGGFPNRRPRSGVPRVSGVDVRPIEAHQIPRPQPARPERVQHVPIAQQVQAEPVRLVRVGRTEASNPSTRAMATAIA